MTTDRRRRAPRSAAPRTRPLDWTARWGFTDVLWDDEHVTAAPLRDRHRSGVADVLLPDHRH
ncbi:hypothetical protein GCM10010123_37130 [Pilimelia anulata]|uniref:Uncharacterized protein n=1 Tax=Pilimelia anulata TaxID=53371 RepID=A0A8J3FC07_9ACTN|nr:hypothetical protein [Pilimelia anulata]GGK03780.1 hypothetical protein GCM10010123_37130 [Pilimelia anulata]